MLSKLVRLKNIGFMAGFAVVAWVGWGTCSYFLDTTLPEVTISGMQEGGCYCGDTQCGVASSKKGDVSVWLDGQPLINNFRMGACSEHPFTIPTRTIANGEHKLKIEVCDRTFQGNKACVERTFKVDNLALQAAFVKTEADNKVFQGRTLHVQFQVNKPIKEASVRTLSQVYECFQEAPQSTVYECFIPIACEENPNEFALSIAIADHVGNTLTLDDKFQVVPYPFKTQNLQLSKDKVTEEKSLGKAIAERERVLEELTKKSPHEKLWHGAFCAPIDIHRVTCDFGTVRTTQEKGRYKHKALDVYSAPKGIVWATHNGVVVLKDRYEDAGNTVVVDHGHGVLSLFYHLDDFARIEVGQKVAQGNPLGTLGKTGYATGYHLHWEMRVNNIAVDPMQWTKASF
ncbi:MAG TPA: M23 family metallopeptidase [Candidatus Limnocylindria bacterium]|nr:M23 family metallopeptidase [Candidatus Limnocylindria bacterium]